MKYGLISVFDKTGIVSLAESLITAGWKLISTGGTYQHLVEHGIKVIEVEDITHFPECLDGRVKTLHPYIHGGILAKRDEFSHRQFLEKYNIPSIDLIVNNLYPFEQTLQQHPEDHDQIIENIDIGGPSMIRAAAKNYKHVAILTDPNDYDELKSILSKNETIPIEKRMAWATKAFSYTAYYDTLIASYFNKKTNKGTFPDKLILAFEKITELRYGENPHQQAVCYQSKPYYLAKHGLLQAEQLQGKELSYNNYIDAQSALNIVRTFEQPTTVAIKHTNPCGVATAETIHEAFEKAHAADPQSIFGGIIAFNRRVNLQTAEQLHAIFLEVIIAPDFDEDALQILQKKKNLRVLKMPIGQGDQVFQLRQIQGGLLIQSADNKIINENNLKVMTNLAPTSDQVQDLLFAWKVVKHVHSNAIVLAKNNSTVAVGPGQVSRIWALENAIRQTKPEHVKGAVLASDAFFPFADCVEVAAKAGIKAIIQSGGSKNDQDSIDKANDLGIAMVFCWFRAFRH